MGDVDPSLAEGGRRKRSPSGARRLSKTRELAQAEQAALEFGEQPGNLITGSMLRQMTETWLSSVALASVVASRDKASLVQSAQEMGQEGLIRLARAVEDARTDFLAVAGVLETAQARITVLQAVLAEQAAAQQPVQVAEA
jgi:hypothetical protein